MSGTVGDELIAMSGTVGDVLGDIALVTIVSVPLLEVIGTPAILVVIGTSVVAGASMRNRKCTGKGSDNHAVWMPYTCRDC